LLALISSEC